MSFKKSINFYNLHIKPALTNQLSLCRVDLLFRNYIVPNIDRYDINFSKYSFSFKVYIIHSLLAFFSVFNILRIKFKKIRIAHYLIDIKNSDDYYDFRSKEILEIIGPKKSANFMHINNFKYSLKTLPKKANVIYFESIYEVMKPFLNKQRFEYVKGDNQFTDNLLETHQNYYSDTYYIFKIVKFILKFLDIDKLISIDDSRYSNELNLAANALDIKTIGYMHGRFNEYHLGLFEFPFDRYLVWSDYFKRMLLSKSSKYKNENIEVVGNFRIQEKKKFMHREKSILWLGESNVDFDEIIPYIEALSKKNYEIIFRGKPGANSTINDFLVNNKIVVDNTDNLFGCLMNHNIGVVIGTHSTALIETWILGVPSFALKCSYDYGSHLWEDGLIELCEDIQSIDKMICMYFSISGEEINQKQMKICGEKYWYDEQKVKKILKD